MAGTSFKQRRGTSQQWDLANPVLLDGEFGVETDTRVVKVGDGANTWRDLSPILDSLYLPVLGKAEDSDKLDGKHAFDFLTTTDAVNTYLAKADAPNTYLTKTDAANTYLRSDAPTASNVANKPVLRSSTGAFATSAVTGLATPAQNDAAANKLYVDARATATGTSRTLVNHFGSVTVFPTTGVRIGDRCFRSDLFSEMFYDGTTWRQVAPAIGTVAQRQAIVAGSLYVGFEFYETDTGRVWRWNGTVWKYQSGGLSPRVKLRGVGTSNLPVQDGQWLGWTTPDYDTDAFFDAANYHVKIPVGCGGLYDIEIQWNVGTTVAYTTSFAFRVIKGVRTAQTSPPTNAIINAAGITATGIINGSVPIRLADNEIYSFQYWTNQSGLNGGSLAFGAPSTVAFTYVGE